MGYAERLRANIGKTALPTSFEMGGMEQLLLRCLIVGQIWKSKQNGKVYSPDGIAPCICVGHHAGVEPKIIVYDARQEHTTEPIDMQRQGRD